MDEKLEDIARSILDLDTLEVRNSDRLDFHELGVVMLRQALEEAYSAGRRSAFSEAE